MQRSPIDPDSAHARRTVIPPSWRGVVAAVLDLLIAVYVLALALVAAGGASLGFVSVRGAEKILLVLAVAIPVRVAVGGRSWLADLVDRARGPARAGRAVLTRVPAAVADTAMALLVVGATSTCVAFLANLLLSPARARGFSLPFEAATFAETFAAWDSGWYFDIASRGYYFRPDGQSSIAFFPLYPTLMRAAAVPFGGSDTAVWVAGILISWVCFAFALVALHRFTNRVTGSRETARRAVLYLAVFPFSLFMTRVYAESVFLLTSTLAIASAYDGRWTRAGLWGGLATLARPNGILIGLPLLILALRDRPRLRIAASRFVPLALVPVALASHCVFVYRLSGDPLAWLNAQSAWGYSLGHLPWTQLLSVTSGVIEQGPYDYFFTSPLAPFQLMHGVVGVLFLALTPAVFQYLGPALGAYVLVSLLVPLSGNALEGVGRYAATLFPVFMVAALRATPRAHEAIVIVSATFLALVACLFVTLHPVY